MPPWPAGRPWAKGARERVQISGPVRWGAVGLALGGAAWLVLGLPNVFGYLQAIPGREDVALLILALLLTAAGLVGLHALQEERHGLLGRVGFYLALPSLVVRAWAPRPSCWEARPSSGSRCRAR